MGHDNLSGLPLIKHGITKDARYLAECFVGPNGLLDASYKERIYAVPDRLTSNECAICPEFELR
jgi:hypothetical protein